MSLGGWPYTTMLLQLYNTKYKCKQQKAEYKKQKYKIQTSVSATQYKQQTSMTCSVLLRPVELKCDRSLVSMQKCVVFSIGILH